MSKLPVVNVCPSLLAEGHATFSPTALKMLFDGRRVSHLLPFESPASESADGNKAVKNANGYTLSYKEVPVSFRSSA